MSRQQAKDTGAHGRSSRWFYSGVRFWLRHLPVIRLLMIGNGSGHQVARVRSLLCLLLSGPVSTVS